MARAKRDLPVIGFNSQQAWDAWLTAQPARSKGLWLKLAKKASGIATVSKSEAIDTALCHGWIDGQLDSFDDDYWLIRFTPRQSTSKWSEKNRARALQLMELKRMRPAGLNEIERAKKDGRWDAAYAPQSTAQVPEDLLPRLQKTRRRKPFLKPWIAPTGMRSCTGFTTPRNLRHGGLASGNSSPCWQKAKPCIRRKPSLAKRRSGPSAGHATSCLDLCRASASSFFQQARTWMAGARCSPNPHNNPRISLSF